jgi:hypothetical protein
MTITLTVSQCHPQAEENNLLNMRRTKTAEDRVRDLHSLLLQKTQVREYKRDREAVRERGREEKRERVRDRFFGPFCAN